MTHQPALFTEPTPASSGPVECLGLTFENDAARRAYFTEKLREKLQDPAFRQIEGFPLGSDEDILALSDPPYYTACPNPFLEDFVKHYGKPYDPTADRYRREPFAVELAESRNNPFVNAHSYATKVPHQAVMRLLLHYTEPGDLVLDAFGGTGMTAVAAQLCANPDQDFIQIITDEMPEAQWGARCAIVGDLSTAATFIARNFNLPDDLNAFEKEAQQLAQEVQAECGWMYETYHRHNQTGNIIVTLWSDVFTCTNCGAEIVFWDRAVNLDSAEIEDKISCKVCGVQNKKTNLERAWVVKFDTLLGHTIKIAKQTPVLIVYECNGKRYEKYPDDKDFELLDQIEQQSIPYWFPTERMPVGEESRRNDDIGVTHVHHFFTKRNLYALAVAWSKAQSIRAKFLLTSLMYKSSLLCAPLMSNFFAAKKGKAGGGWVGKERSGTLYYPSIHSEVAIVPQIKSRTCLSTNF